MLSTQANALGKSGKKILIAFDGSGESPKTAYPDEKTDSNFSNVLKLHLLAGGSIDEKKTQEKLTNQISLYEAGVGGRSDNQVVRLINTVIGRLSQQTRPMTKRLEEIYEEGDKLYITGFSRGAASARRLAVSLNTKGLRTASGKRVKEVPVEFLGCFDTVSDQFHFAWNPLIRFDFYNRFFNLDIQSAEILGEKNGETPSNVKKAVHYLSLDDKRAGSFTPVLMDAEDKRVTEVWFPGCHSDIGGGYYQDGVANGAGANMQNEMEGAGLKFMSPLKVDAESLKIPGSNKPALNARCVSLVRDPSDTSHEAIYIKPRNRPIRSVTKDRVIDDGTVYVHESALQRLQSEKPEVSRGEKPYDPYEINPNLALANFKVIGDDGNVRNSETQMLKKIVTGN